MARLTIINKERVVPVDDLTIIWSDTMSVGDREGSDSSLMVETNDGQNYTFEVSFGSGDFVEIGTTSQTSVPFNNTGVFSIRAYKIISGRKVYSNVLRYLKKAVTLDPITKTVEYPVYCQRDGGLSNPSENRGDCICRGSQGHSISEFVVDSLDGVIERMPVHLGISGQSGDRLQVGSHLRHLERFEVIYYANNSGGLYDNVDGCRSMFHNAMHTDRLTIKLSNGQYLEIDFDIKDRSHSGTNIGL